MLIYAFLKSGKIETKFLTIVISEGKISGDYFSLYILVLFDFFLQDAIILF